MRKFHLLLALILVLCSCSSSFNCPGYVEADELLYTAIAQEYIELTTNAVMPDGKKQFSEDQINRRKKTIELWKRRIDATKESIK